MKELRDLSQKTHVPHFIFACIYLGLGEFDKCFDWLDKAISDHDSMIILLHHLNPVLSNPLRSDPRYKALPRKMNLET